MQGVHMHSGDCQSPSLGTPSPQQLQHSISRSLGDDGMRCLLVRHLPAWLSREEKESLFGHFGAQEIVVMPNKGKMRNCVFAAFASHTDAKMAMGKLHQLDVFGYRLVVEYARPSHAGVVHEAELDKWSCDTCKDKRDDKEIREVNKPPQPMQTHPKPTRTPSHCYLYPHPTPSTIANITNAIVCVPDLYVQVLHLMNKMNLPPPFGPPTPIPPLLLEPISRAASEYEERQPLAASSGEESSEIESDEETKISRKPQPTASPKRRKVSYKKMLGAMPPSKKRRGEESVLEEDLKPVVIPQTKKIEFHMPTELSLSQPATEGRGDVTVAYIGGREVQPVGSGVPSGATQPSSHLQLEAAVQGSCEVSASATTLVVSRRERVQEEEEKEEVKEPDRFITLAELTTNKLSEAEMKEEHVFKKYSIGEPSLRLYLKNLAKQVEEKDLRYIYGRYINWSDEEEINMFDIRLMKSGRMKGQAFIGLPSEAVASQALRETNGYLLHGRPIVVHFARSSRPKDTAD